MFRKLFSNIPANTSEYNGDTQAQDKLCGDSKAPLSADSLNCASLAFLGDAVYGLLVREYLVNGGSLPAGRLHDTSVKLVNAAAQARAVKRITPMLSEAEADIYKRGRNTHVAHCPRNQSAADYHSATGLECLFGYLYLKDNNSRLCELFNIAIEGELID